MSIDIRTTLDLNVDMNNRKQLLFIAFLLFNLFGFKYLEPYIIPPVQAWILASGSMAAVYYSIAGLVSVVIAPITLGPIHVILQKSFGFWMSFGLFYGFTTIGQLINFGLAKKYGEKFVNRFFPDLHNNVFYNWLRSNIDRSIFDMMLINVGLGGDFLAYLFGLSKVKFWRFAIVVIVVNLFSTYIIVSKNIAVGDTGGYLFWFGSSYFITYIPLLIVFRKDLPQLWAKIQKATQDNQEARQNYENAKADYQKGIISIHEFEAIKAKNKELMDNPLSGLFVDKEMN